MKIMVMLDSLSYLQAASFTAGFAVYIRYVSHQPPHIRIHDLKTEDGTLRLFEVENTLLTWSRACRIAESILGAVIVRRSRLFRDMDEPDLWIGTDGNGRWGEMNGAHREELDGCVDIELSCTPFTYAIPIRRLPLHVGHSADITVASVDVETLDVQPARRRYTRLDIHRWRVTQLDTGVSIEFDVDEFGLPADIDDVASLAFRRVT